MISVNLTKKLIFPLLICSILTFQACDKGEGEEPLPVLGCTDQGALNFDPLAELSNESCTYPELEFGVSYKVGNEIFHTDSIYYLGTSQVAVKFTGFKFYISNIVLTDDAGEEKKINDGIALISSDYDDYTIGEFNKGRYTNLSFNLGVDEETNQLNPDEFVNGHPLSSNDMFRGNNGYLFLRAFGNVDTDFDGLFSNQISLDLGTLDLLRTISVPVDIVIENVTTKQLKFEVDLARVFESVDLATNFSVDFASDPKTANQIMDNLVKSISLK